MNKFVLVVVVALAIALSTPPNKANVMAEMPISVFEITETEALFAFKETKEVVDNNPEKEKCTCGGSKVERHDGVSPSPCRCLSNGGRCECGKGSVPVSEPAVEPELPFKARTLLYFTPDAPGQLTCIPCAEQSIIFNEMKKSGWIFSDTNTVPHHFVITWNKKAQRRFNITAAPAFLVVENNAVVNKNGQPAVEYGKKTQEEVVKFYYENIGK
jgi:hypothetical protein